MNTVISFGILLLLATLHEVGALPHKEYALNYVLYTVICITCYNAAFPGAGIFIIIIIICLFVFPQYLQEDLMAFFYV